MESQALAELKELLPLADRQETLTQQDST